MFRYALALALPLAALAAPAAAQDEDGKEVKAAKELLKKQAVNVVLFAHPPGKYKDVAFNGFSKLKDGFELTYTFSFDGPVRKGHTTKLKFTFDKVGKLDFLSKVETTAVEPFTKDVSAKKLAELKDKVKGVPAVKDDRKLLKEVEEAKDSKVLLEIWLRHATVAMPDK